jgi:hypothetical protein
LGTDREISEIAAVDGRAAVEAERHQPEPGGCTCGFSVWSTEHVVIMTARVVVAAAVPHIEAAIREKTLQALVEQARIDQAQSAYWRQRWTDGQGDEIGVWLLSLIDFGWPRGCSR